MSYRILRTVCVAARRSFKSTRKLHKATRPVVAEMLERRTLLSVSAYTLMGQQMLTQGSQYVFTNASGTGTDTITVAGPATSPTGQESVEWDETTILTAGAGSTGNYQEYLAETTDGVVEYAKVGGYTGGGGTTELSDTYSPLWMRMPATLTVGQTYQYTYTDNQTVDGTAQTPVTHTLTYSLPSDTPQSVTVPAGTFSAYEIDYTDQSTALGGTVDQYQEYFAPGVGLVKSIDHDLSNGTNPTWSLKSYNAVTANTLIWTGGGDGLNWSDGNNWNLGIHPANGDNLVFPTGAPLTTNNDLAGLSINDIDIQGSGYTLEGDAISLTGGLSSDAGNNTYDINTALVGSPTLDDMTGDLDIKSVLSGGGGMTLAGAGTFTFDQADTYTGPTTLSSGITIDDNVLSDVFADSDLTIGAGSAGVTLVGSSSGTDTLDNDITFQSGATLIVDPPFGVDGNVTLNGPATIKTPATNDFIYLNGNVEGTGALTLAGSGSASVANTTTIGPSVNLIIANGLTQLSGELTGEVTLAGGVVQLMPGLSGDGSLDLQTGKAQSGGCGFEGDVTLEQAEVDVTGAGTDALGTGDVTVATPGSGATTPIIDATAVSGGAILDNNFTFNSGAQWIAKGVMNLVGTDILTGIANEIQIQQAGIVILKGELEGNGTLTAIGDGIVQFADDMDAGVHIIVNTAKSKLAAALDAADTELQQVVLAGGIMLITSDLNGSGGLDLKAGTVQSAGCPGYDGNVTLEQTEVDVTGATDPLGTGDVNVTTPGSGATTPIIDATAVSGGATLDNDFTFQSAAKFIAKGVMNLVGTDILTGIANEIQIQQAGIVILKGELEGNGTLTAIGDGIVQFADDMDNGVHIIVKTAKSKLAAALDAADTELQQVILGAGIMLITSDLKGSGGLDVQAGTLQTDDTSGAAGAPGYDGTITLESGATIDIYDTVDNAGLGTGTLDIKGGTFQNSSNGAVTIDNPVTLEGDVSLSTPSTNPASDSQMQFTGTITVNAPSTVTIEGGRFLLSGDLDGDQEMTIDGSTGNVILNGITSAPVVLENTAAIGASGTFYGDGIGGALADEGLVTIDNAQTIAVIVGTGGATFTTLSGAGDIDVEAGTLMTDQTSGAGGCPDYTGTITLNDDGTINVYDVTDKVGLGTGTLDLKGGTFQNSSQGAVAFAIPVTLEGDVSLITPATDPPSAGQMLFSNTITVSAASTVTISGGRFVLGDVTGTQELTIEGSTGNVILNGTTSAPVALENVAAAGASGQGVMGDGIGGALAAGGSVTIDGAQTVAAIIGTGGIAYETLSGTGGIDVQDGTLMTDQTYGVGGNPDYSGTITLEDTGTIKVYDNVDNVGLGTGTLDIKGGTLQNSYLSSPGAVTLNNPVTLEGDVSLITPSTNPASDGQMQFTGTITVSAESAATIQGGRFVLGDVTGTQELTIEGSTGNVILNGTTSAPVALENTAATGASGTFYGDGIGGTLAASGSVTIDNAQTVAIIVGTGGIAYNTLSGTGSIDVLNGTLMTDQTSGAGGLPGYRGTITLDLDGTIKDYDTEDNLGLGAGTLDIKGGTIQNSYLTAPGAVMISNPVTMEGDVSLITPLTNPISEGQLRFTNTITVNAASTVTLNDGHFVIDTLAGSQTVTFEGSSGQVTLDKSIGVPVVLENTGTNDLSGNLLVDGLGGTLTASGSITIDNPQTVVMTVGTGGGGSGYAPLQGTGSIDIKDGTLVTDEIPGDSGNPNYSGQITLEEDGTLKVYDEADNVGLGTGTLDLKGGLLQNSSLGAPGAVTINNPVTLEGDVSLSTPLTNPLSAGQMYFSNTITVSAPSTVTLNQGHFLMDTLAGTQTVTFDGTTGQVTLDKWIAAPVVFENAASPSLSGGNLVDGIAGTLTAAGSITIDGAQTTVSTVGFNGAPYTPLNGAGSIDVKNGTLETDTTPGAGGDPTYTGTVTLEANGTITIKDATDNVPLGTGTLDIKGGTIQNSSSGAVTINNPVTLEGDVSLSTPLTSPLSAGQMYFSNTITVTALSTVTLNGGHFLMDTLAGAATLTFEGSTGQVTLDKSIGTSVWLDNAASPGVSGGNLVDGLAGTLTSAGSITIDNTQTIVQTVGLAGAAYTPLNGTGNIDVAAGMLETDQTPGAGGDPNYNGLVTVESGGTLALYEAVDSAGFGTGTLDLKGGLLANVSGGAPTLNNHVIVEGPVTVEAGLRLKFRNSLYLSPTGSLDVTGTLALAGALTGSGSITLNGDMLAVSSSNPAFTGNVTVNSGTVEVTSDNALGTGTLIEDLTTQGVLESVDSIGDPIIGNALTVQAGTLVVEGQLTFPQGIVIDAGATLDVEGSSSQITVTGPLAGGGTLLIGSGYFSDPGGSSGFTGPVTLQSGMVQPTMTVTDAGGVYTGSPYPATALLSAPGVTNATSLEGVSPTLAYYNSSNTELSGAPTAPGSYTVIGTFPGSTHYLPYMCSPVPFTITSATPAKLVFTTGPSAGTAGSKLTAISVSIETAGNTVVSSDNASVTLTIASGPGGFASGSTTTVAAVNGVATFSNLILDTAGNYVLSAADSTDSLSGFTSTSFNVAPAAATHFALSAPSAATAGTAFNFTVTALDQFGNTASGYTGTVHFTSTDGAATLPANATLTSGVGTFSATLKTAGAQTITATDTTTSSIVGATGAISVSPAVATHYSVVAPSTATAGTAFNFTVTALDQFGNTATAYTGTVHFTSSDGSAVLPVNATLTKGVGTFSATLTTVGQQTITATDTVTTSVVGSSGAITVAAATATHFTVSAPSSATAGTPVSITVTALDQFGNTATGYTGTVHFTSTDGSAILPANATLTKGVGTFSATLETAGKQTITATDTVTTSIVGTSGAITVAAAATATHFTVSAASSATAGTPLSFTVTALDASNDTATGYTGTVHFTSTDGSATLPVNATLTNGVGTFSATLKTAGKQTITATDTVTNSIVGTSGAITVAAAAATHFTVSAPSTATAGTAFNFTVTALDQFGNTATGYTGTVHWTSTDAAAVLPANSTLTNGTATFSATLNTAGSQTITATDTAHSTIVGVSGSILVSAASTAEKLVFLYTPLSGHAGALAPVTVLVENAKGQLVLSDHSQVTLSVASGPGVLGGTVKAKVFLGVALFTNLSLTKAGVYTLKAGDGSDTVAISHSFTITAAAPSQLVFTQQPGNATAGGTLKPVVVDVEDKFGNIVTGDNSVVTLSLATDPPNAKLNGTLSERAVSGVATFSNLSLNVAGTYQFRATDGCLASAVSSSFAISPGAATHAAFLVLPTSAKHRKAFTVEVVLLDKYNNVATNDTSKVTLSLGTHPKNATLTGTLTAAVVNGIATFNNLVLSLAGSYSLVAADSNGLPSIASSLFNVA